MARCQRLVDYGNDNKELLVVQGWGSEAAPDNLDSKQEFRGIVRDSGGDIFGLDTLGTTDEYFVGTFMVSPSASPSDMLREQMYSDGTSVLDNPSNADYDSTTWDGTHTLPTIGVNPNAGQQNSPLNGDIAAIMVYDGNIEANELNGLQSYLYDTYLIPEPSTFVLLALAGVYLLQRRRRR